MNLIIKNLVKSVGLPPMLLLWVLFMGLFFKLWLAWVALGLFYLLSTAPVANMLLRRQEFIPPLVLPVKDKNSVIVILGAGIPRHSPERDGFRPSPYTLERLRYGSWLQKQTGYPLLVTGGGNRPEANTMAQSLKEDFGVRVNWMEDQSRTTWENALYTRAMLPEDIDSVILVTHAWHMPRSIWSFEKVGFKVIPAPTAFTGADRIWAFRHWVPRVHNLEKSERAIREIIGRWWYVLDHRA